MTSNTIADVTWFGYPVEQLVCAQEQLADAGAPVDDAGVQLAPMADSPQALQAVNVSVLGSEEGKDTLEDTAAEVSIGSVKGSPEDTAVEVSIDGVQGASDATDCSLRPSTVEPDQVLDHIGRDTPEFLLMRKDRKVIHGMPRGGIVWLSHSAQSV